MKNLLIYLSMILFSMNVNAQTEKETIDFLNSMSSAYSAPMYNGPTKSIIRTEIDSRSHQKVIVIDFFVNTTLLETNRFHGISINTISISEAPNGNPILKIISPENLILRKYVNRTNETFENLLQMPFNCTKDDAQRIRKAFLHLFKLNGAKLIDENLFKN